MKIASMLLFLAMVCRSDAVMFLDTPDPSHNTTTPGDNSGWQYEGKFRTFLGVPIAPHFFITAAHFGGSVGMVFDFHGDSYVTIGFQDGPGTDLRIWEVNHAKPFPTYAPLSSGVMDVGATASIVGRGTQRGVEVFVGPESKGWKWGPGDGVKRWGRNVVNGAADGGVDYGELLYCSFDKPGIADECHLSTGDSGGGMFVLESGLWRLAGIHLSVDGPFRLDATGGGGFHAALCDKGGMQELTGDPATWESIPEQAGDIPSRFYSSRISTSLPWILEETEHDGSLAQENYAAWQRLYFSPAQIAASAVSGPLGDFDQDGIVNLLEFALNLDPTFSEQITLAPAVGLRGLPNIRVETISGEERVTVEYVRRTVASGSGLTCFTQFSSDLGEWTAGGTETVVAINPRWERVKVVDSLPVSGSSRRFARVRVVVVE